MKPGSEVPAFISGSSLFPSYRTLPLHTPTNIMSVRALEVPLAAWSVSVPSSTTASPRPLSPARLRSIGPISRTNSRDWLSAMQHTLESHGVLAFLGSRPSAAPSLSADPTKRAEVLAYEDGLSLACFLLAEHCGSDATSCLVPTNPRASWRRSRGPERRREAHAILDVVPIRGRHEPRQVAEEDGHPARAGALEQARRRDADVGPRLPRYPSRQPPSQSPFPAQKFTTMLDDAANQLHQLQKPLVDAAATDQLASREVVSPQPPSSVASDDLEVEMYYQALPLWRRDRPSTPPVVVPPFRILDLPPELINSILSHLAPHPILKTNELNHTFNVAVNAQAGGLSSGRPVEGSRTRSVHPSTSPSATLPRRSSSSTTSAYAPSDAPGSDPLSFASTSRHTSGGGTRA